MRHRFLTPLGAFALVGFLSSGVAVQHAAPQGGGQPPAGQAGRLGSQAAGPPDTRPFNARELSGIWAGSMYEFNRTTGPAFTAEGKRRFDLNKPSYGPRAVPPALGTDYVGTCNPLGVIRNLVYSPAPMEFVQTADRVFQRFEWTWDHREIWTDGRQLPASLDDYLPRFNGYSAGKWEDDTFVVDTIGLDDRQWVDHWGHPLSTRARLQERWKRTSYSTLTLTMTLTDPDLYASPWVSGLATFRLVAREQTTIAGWSGLLEDRCVPLDEVEQFNRRVRNPAAGVK